LFCSASLSASAIMQVVFELRSSSMKFSLNILTEYCRFRCNSLPVI